MCVCKHTYIYVCPEYKKYLVKLLYCYFCLSDGKYSCYKKIMFQWSKDKLLATSLSFCYLSFPVDVDNINVFNSNVLHWKVLHLHSCTSNRKKTWWLNGSNIKHPSCWEQVNFKCLYASQQPMTFLHNFLCMNIMAFIFDALKIVKFSITTPMFFCPLYSAISVFLFPATTMSLLGSFKEHGRRWHAIQQRTVTWTTRSRSRARTPFHH